MADMEAEVTSAPVVAVESAPACAASDAGDCEHSVSVAGWTRLLTQKVTTAKFDACGCAWNLCVHPQGNYSAAENAGIAVYLQHLGTGSVNAAFTLTCHGVGGAADARKGAAVCAALRRRDSRAGRGDPLLQRRLQ